MKETPKQDYSKAEADRRRDELARRILSTPPEPRKDKPAKPKGQKQGGS